MSSSSEDEGSTASPILAALSASRRDAEDLVYDAQDLLFEGDLDGAIKAAAGAIDRLEGALATAGSGTTGVLPPKLARVAHDAMEVLLGAQMQRTAWHDAMNSARRWVSLCGPAGSLRPYALGSRAAFCGFHEACREHNTVHHERTHDAADVALFLSERLFDPKYQRALAGGRDGIAAGQLLLEQAQALAQLADMTAALSASESAASLLPSKLSEIQDRSKRLDDHLQNFIAEEEGGMTALEPHEQGRVMSLSAWARSRLTTETLERRDALMTLGLFSDSILADIQAQAQAAELIRAEGLANNNSSSQGKTGDNNDATADNDVDDMAAAAAASVDSADRGSMDAMLAAMMAGAGGGGDGDFDMSQLLMGGNMEMGMEDLSSAFKLMTGVPSPLDLGLGFMYALHAFAALDKGTSAADDDIQAALEALGKAQQQELGDDENVAGTFFLLTEAIGSEPLPTDLDEDAPELAAWNRVHKIRSDAATRQQHIDDACRAANPLIHQRVLSTLNRSKL